MGGTLDWDGPTPPGATEEDVMVMKLLETHLVHSWAWIVLRGVLAIAFGLVCLIAPGIALTALVFFWGAYALVDGAIALGAGMHTNAWQMTAIGIVGVVAGVLTFLLPGLTAVMLLVLIAIWALIAGAFDVAAALRFRQELRNEWLLILSGIVSIVAGIVMLVRPGAGALAFVWLIGGFSALTGLLELVHGLRLRGLDDHGHTVPRPA
jgi:uncharacterized membrane protein HdeD (DUF308 family)